MSRNILCCCLLSSPSCLLCLFSAVCRFCPFLSFPIVQNYNHPVEVSWRWLSTEIGASVAEHAQGSLITPAVIDKNKRSGEERGKNSTELQQRTQSNLQPPRTLITPSTATAQPVVNAARFSSHLGRGIHWVILIIACSQMLLIH